MSWMPLAVLFVVATGLPATEDAYQPAAPVKADVADLAWMSGSWSGAALGGQAEEHWSTPRAGTIMGMFRLVSGAGRVTVYELLLIEQDGEEIAMRFRHFGPAHKPWEAPDKPLTFRVVSLRENEVVFESQQDQNKPRRITYRRAGDKLSAHVQGVADGALDEGFHVRMTQTRLPS